ncbi:DNA-damage-repair/toleration protein like [Verticillium longisporum]|nr:DNA-damage-repair/toleration protein like [Verticillium longisporum]
MAAPPPPPPARGGLSLYANLLDPTSDPSATISSAPVRYNQDGSATDIGDDAAAKKPKDPSLRFQPIRRPQAKAVKPKPSFPKAASQVVPLPPGPATSDVPTAVTTLGGAQSHQKTSLADWAAAGDDEVRYSMEKRQRGGRKKKKKKFDHQLETDWDEIYDPTRPTNVDEYLRSDERIREVQDWKAVLYRHRRKKSFSDDSDQDSVRDSRLAANQFAPPSNYSFAPPPPSPPTLAQLPDDASADDVYARRQALQTAPVPPPLDFVPPPTPPPPPPPSSEPTETATISRAPVRYSPPKPSEDDVPDSPPPSLGLGAGSHTGNRSPDSEAPRSLRPGQAGFAQRLMSKYGWTKGSGLGADESGIINPLRVQVEKRKKKSDAEGGGWRDPANKAKIIGGQRRDDGAASSSGYGPMSNVIVLRNMLEGMQDLQGEISSGLGQEIGEECGDKYGRVERLYFDVENRQVFIKFTDQVSGLRAVSELNGRVFNGNTVAATFYDSEQFELGVYI